MLTGQVIEDMQTLTKLNSISQITGELIIKLETFNKSINSQELGTRDYTIFRTVIFGEDTSLIPSLQFVVVTLMEEMDSQL